MLPVDDDDELPVDDEPFVKPKPVDDKVDDVELDNDEPDDDDELSMVMPVDVDDDDAEPDDDDDDTEPVVDDEPSVMVPVDDDDDDEAEPVELLVWPEPPVEGNVVPLTAVTKSRMVYGAYNAFTRVNKSSKNVSITVVLGNSWGCIITIPHDAPPCVRAMLPIYYYNTS